ncbi:uncharacterized protein LOC132195289 [Neocloeon triangulifer]|uniref:uncharacterized protein LOC132195289 n=1 Tax=Neocloeon triangulifer TaxID=2078957 RepID=UPI00286F401F|nr:uncharacterized protein LOC132195289 [Neocloeon triangulifer]
MGSNLTSLLAEDSATGGKNEESADDHHENNGPIIGTSSNADHQQTTENGKSFENTCGLPLEIYGEAFDAEFTGVVRHVQSYNCIFVATDAQVSVVERLSHCFQSLFEANQKAQNKHHISYGDVVILKGKKGDFLRADVTEIIEEYGTSSGGILQVTLIDFGEVILVEAQDCVKISEAQYQLKAPQVQKVGLKIVYDVKALEQLKHKINTKLFEILKRGDKVRVCFCINDSSEMLPKAIITKMETSEEEEDTVNNQVSQVLATSKSNALAKLKNNSLAAISASLELDCPSKAITGYEPKDETRACRIYQIQGFCNRANCRKEHFMLHPDGWTHDQELIFTKPFSFLDLDISAGSYLLISVTNTTFSNFYRFYGHILNLPSEHGSLDELNQQILHLAENSSLEIFEILPALGQMVIARDDKENIFRATVVDFNYYCDKSRILVFSVDYGFEKEVDLHNVWKMHPSLLHVPFQVVEFFCEDLNPSDIQVGSKIEATCVRVDSELNVEIELQKIL